MCKSCATSSNTVYGLGLIGALVYNWQYADGATEILWGIVKSIFWPALMIYKVLTMLQI